jgi:predicted lipoprotein with Yx(FWY)xxD motif
MAGCGASARASLPASAKPTTTRPTAAKPTAAKPTTTQAVVPPGPESPEHPTVDVRFFPQVHARVLADAQGYALYLYVPDHRKAVTCVASCAQSWPPVLRAPGTRVHVGSGADPRLVGSDRDPIHGRVVTYRGWPLYTYAEDAQPGFALGQALDIDGGYWYLIRPDGRPLIPPA